MSAARIKGATAETLRVDTVDVGAQAVTLDDVVALARGERLALLCEDPDFRRRIDQSRAAVEAAVADGQPVYGVTTGVGRSVDNDIPEHLRSELPHNLLRFHGCGTGRILDEVEAAAVVAVRLVSLARGVSGVRYELLERLCTMLNLRILPRIPAEGSVGASGDLTPLSYVAATIIGEREVSYRGEVMPAATALADAGLDPLRLAPKESLSLMNGTAVMTALACLAIERALRLARLASAVTAMASDAIGGNPGHFDPRLFELKPHPGQQLAAAWIRRDLECADPVDQVRTPARTPARLQDRYSVRCAPHVIGVLLDAIEWGTRTIEIELNGADDNPLVDPETGDLLHGGNFYGGHVCFVMDGIKAAVASVADLLDRQLTLLCCPDTSDGLPANLVADDGDARVTHHGFKAMQISASALTAEALKLTMPAGSFSRSTESHNQDKVSMGTIAARDCLRILELSETVAAIGLLAACQAADLRDGDSAPKRGIALRSCVREQVPLLTTDRRQDVDIETVLRLHHDRNLPIGTLDGA